MCICLFQLIGICIPVQPFHARMRLAVENTAVGCVANSLGVAVVDRACICLPLVIVVIQSAAVGNCRFHLVDERNFRSNRLDKRRMFVKCVMRNLQDITLQICGRIHRHKDGIGFFQVAGQEHFLAVKGYAQDGRCVICLCVVSDAGCIIQKELLRAVGSIAILNRVKDIKLHTCDIEGFSRVLLVILCVREGGYRTADILLRGTFGVKIIHNVLQLQLCGILLQETGEACTMVIVQVADEPGVDHDLLILG